MPSTPFRIVVFASGNGSDLQAIIDEMKQGKMPGIELVAVFSDKKDSYALERSLKQGFKAIFVSPKGRTRKEFDERLIQLVDKEAPDLIVLAGYMRIFTSAFVQHFKKKIINVHPALLPKFGGQGMYGHHVHEAVLAAGEKETGMTIHYVDEGVDSGPIIIQEKIPIAPGDSPDTLKEKVVALEKKAYPEVIRKLAAEKK